MEKQEALTPFKGNKGDARTGIPLRLSESKFPLTFHSTHGNTLSKVFLEAQEHNDNRNRRQRRTSHDQAEVIGHLLSLIHI